MLNRSASLLFASLCLLPACRFNPEVPVGAQISCREQAECPAGFRCVTQVQRCFRNDSEDREAPRLTAELPTRPVRPGTMHPVKLRANEPLTALEVFASPVGSVTSSVPGFDAIVDGTEGSVSVVAGAADGPVRLLASAVDESGNIVTDAELGVLNIDGTAPTVVSITAPQAVRPGQPFVVQVAFSEPVAPGVVVSLTSSGISLTAQPSRVESTLVTALLNFDASAADGSYLVSIQEAFDAAGNEMAPLTVEQTRQVSLDGTRPFVQRPVLTRSRFSQVSGFNQVAIPVIISESAATAGVCLGVDCRTARTGETVTFDVTSAIPEGPAFVTLSATDAVGNVSEQVTVPVTFDYSAPQIVAGTATIQPTPRSGCPLPSVTALGPGSSALLSLSLDELTVRDPIVSLTQPVAAASVLRSATASTYTFTTELPQSLTADGAAQWQITAEDLVGNGATVTVPLSIQWRVDSTPPAQSLNFAPGAVTYRRAPWGTVRGPVAFELHADAGVFETGTTLRVLAEADLGSLELGRTAVTTDAGFVLPLSNSDRASVWVSSIDSACNQTPATEVKDIEWVATSGGKVAASTLENPHVFERFTNFGGSRVGGTEVAGAMLARFDGQGEGVDTNQQDWALRLFKPPARNSPAMVFDTDRHRMVMVSASGLSEVWEYDGLSWEQRIPVDGISRAVAGAPQLVYDSGRHRVVAAGLLSALGEPLNEFFEWDGTRWSTTGPMATGPFAQGGRLNYFVAYDPENLRLLLYGGKVGGVDMTDLWSFDGSKWVDLTVPGGPPTNFRMVGMVWDPVRHLLVAIESNFAGARVRSYDGTAWSTDQVSSSPFAPYDLFGARQAVVFDASLQAVVLMARTLFAPAVQAWAWSGPNQWSRVDASSVTQPPDRVTAAAAYDPDRQRTMLFGGVFRTEFSSALKDDAWWLTAAGWQEITLGVQIAPALGNPVLQQVWNDTQHLWVSISSSYSSLPVVYETSLTARRLVAPATSTVPSARGGFAALAWDADNQRLLAFGGRVCTNFYAPNLCDSFADLDDLWAFKNDTWSELIPATGVRPGARTKATLVWNRATQRLELMNGYTVNDVPTQDHWQFDGTSWSRVGALPFTFGARVVFDTVSQGLVAFGGGSDVYLTAPTSNGIWRFDNTSWNAATVSGTQPPNTTGALGLFHTALGRSLFIGGAIPGSPSSNVTWAWSGTSWSSVSTPMRPTAFTSDIAAYDSQRQRAVLTNGWELGLRSRIRPGLTARFNLASAQAGAAVSTGLRISAVAGASGFDGVTPVSGVELGLLTRGAYLGRTRNAAPVDAAAAADIMLTDALAIDELLTGPQRELGVSIAPAGWADGAPFVRPAHLAVDGIEVVWSYRRP